MKSDQSPRLEPTLPPAPRKRSHGDEEEEGQEEIEVLKRRRAPFSRLARSQGPREMRRPHVKSQGCATQEREANGNSNIIILPDFFREG
jgi:hypothetical protein